MAAEGELSYPTTELEQHGSLNAWPNASMRLGPAGITMLAQSLATGYPLEAMVWGGEPASERRNGSKSC